VWHDSFICVTWLIHMCDMTHSYVWHDSFICVTWCHMMHSYTWMSHGTQMNGSHVNESCHKYEFAMSHIGMSHVSHYHTEEVSNRYEFDRTQQLGNCNTRCNSYCSTRCNTHCNTHCSTHCNTPAQYRGVGSPIWLNAATGNCNTHEHIATHTAAHAATHTATHAATHTATH